jgi:hypothetical protein
MLVVVTEVVDMVRGVVGNRVEALVDQPGWDVVLLWEGSGAGVICNSIVRRGCL